MRFILILIIAVPALMAFRTLGLFRDWIMLRRWSRQGVAYGEPAPALTEPIAPGTGPAAATAEAWRKLVASALSTAAAACFALAGGLAVAWMAGLV